jgi:hypothetical protein
MNRARDLTFSIVSETDRFDTERPSRDLEDLARTARDTGDEFDQAARDADDAMDALARSTRVAAGKVDDDSDRMKRSLRDVGDEAGSTAREAAASFSSSGDIGDALQEVAANAPATLGPLGLAFGAVAGIGVGLFRAEADKLKERVDTLVDEFIEAGGRLSKEFIDGEVLQLVKDGEAARLEELVDRYDLAGITYRDMVRARAGEEAAIDRITAALDAESGRRKTSEADMTRSEAAVAALRDGIGAGEEATRLAKLAMEEYQDATEVGTAKAGEDWNTLRLNMERGITAPVKVNAPSAAQLNAIRLGIVRGIGPVSVTAKVTPQVASTNIFYPGRYRP